MTETTLSARVAEVERNEKVGAKYIRGLQNLLIDLATGRPLRTEGVENTHMFAKAQEIAAALAQARVEGARGGFADGAVWYARWGASLSEAQALMVYHQAHEEYARRYPAPSAHAGEARPECKYCHDTRKIWSADGNHSRTCPECRPDPTPEPPLVRLNVEQGTMAVFVTPDDAVRIVALGSRPTQTAEG